MNFTGNGTNGNVQEPIISVSPNPKDFLQVQVTQTSGLATLTVANNGTADLIL